jgi:PAS domain S-box-containing protein
MDIVTALKSSRLIKKEDINILDSLPALISYVDADLKYVYVNKAFIEFHKLKDYHSVIGKTIQEVLGTEIYKAAEKYILKALHGEKTFFEVALTREGKNHHFDITYTPDFDDDGKIVGYISFVNFTPERTAELLQKNEALKKSEERYHKMVDEVQDYAIILLDIDGNILDWNKGAQKIKGYKSEEIIGQNFRIFYMPEDRNRMLPETLINDAITTGRAEHEGWRVKKDGTKFWGSIIITALHDENNEVIGFSKVTRDLTERKAAEENQQNILRDLERKNEEIRKSEERYHKMIAEVEDYAIILLDRSGNIQNWNKGAENIKGYTASEIQGRNFRLFYSAEDRQSQLPERLLKEAVEKGKATHEGWRIKKDGTRFWGSIVITALHDDENKIIGFSKVTRDLTERKAAEEQQQRYALELQHKNEELRRSEERYHKMISEVEDYAIILLDPDGRVQNWNKGAERIKGYKPEEIVGRSFTVFYSPEDIANGLPQQLITEAAEKGNAHHEGWRLKKDGSKFWGAVVITALHDQQKNIIGFSKVTRDLTERKIAEDIQKQNAEQLEAQNKELEQFAYVASHDLQEPLRKIRTFNSLIIEHEGDKLSTKTKDYFERSISAADRMNQLIEDLLTFSRATRDAHKLEPVDLNKIVSRIKTSQKENNKKIIIESDHLPELHGMQFHFEQLFENLIGNGLKYQSAGNTPHISIRYATVNGDDINGKQLGASSKFHQITFNDNGIGFEQEHAEKIFEMFQRLHGRSEYTGSGIGLAIVKKIVQNYGGYITAEGRPGEGASFKVYFPVNRH